LNAPFDLSSPEAPIYTRARFLPPTRFDDATIRDSLVADGSVIEPGAVIENSVIGLRCRIGRNVVIRNTVLMGADFYETPEAIAAHRSNGNPPLGVGEGSHIEGAIIDKNARIGRNVRIVNEKGLDNTVETPFGMICDGIVVSAKNTTLPDGWKL
jgi:glucose-1-phosphate adenylyltransferase